MHVPGADVALNGLSASESVLCRCRRQGGSEILDGDQRALQLLSEHLCGGEQQRSL